MTGVVVGRRTPTYARVDKPREAQTCPGRLPLMPTRLHKLPGRRCGCCRRCRCRSLLVALGGAYAVLAYVHQAAVGQFCWLSAAQMLVGLALCESTSGLRTMVLVFVAALII